MPPIAGRMSIGGPRLVAIDGPGDAASVRNFVPTEPPGAAATHERRLKHRRSHRLAAAHRLRPTRFAYRPRGYGGLAGLLFGGWRF
jgi:hypothetical protein